MGLSPRRLTTRLIALAITLTACAGDNPAAPTPPPVVACSFTVGDGPSAAVAPSGVEFTISIVTTAGCSWTASSSAAFITAVGAATGSGNGTARFAVQSNTGDARQGTVSVAGRTLTVSQNAGTPETCDYVVTPVDAAAPEAGAEITVAVTVTRGENCAWTAASHDAFITVKSGGDETGSGQAVLQVAANSGAARTGSATVAGRTITIAQAGTQPSCAFTVAPLQVNAPATASSATITITMTQGQACPWTATVPPQSAFVSLTGPASGAGDGSVGISIAANAGSARSGTLIVSGQTITIQQSAPPAGPAAAVLRYQSEPGDYIGQGQSNTYTLTGSQFTVTLDSTLGELRFGLPPSGGTWWNLTLEAPAGQQLTPGLYTRATRSPFQHPSSPGLDFSGSGRGCNQLTGRFLVAQAVFGPGNTVQRFHARFEQHCENWSVALRGEIWIDAQGSTIPPPITPLPTGPASPTTFLSFVSDPGDYIGQGTTQHHSLATMKFTARADSVATIQIETLPGAGFVRWNLGLETPSGQQLLPGTYSNATRYPFNAPGVPGLSFSGDGRGCNTLTGSFVVLEADYGPGGEVFRFHATFEQHCEGAVPALRGEIRIVADPWQ